MVYRKQLVLNSTVVIVIRANSVAVRIRELQQKDQIKRAAHHAFQNHSDVVVMVLHQHMVRILKAVAWSLDSVVAQIMSMKLADRISKTADANTHRTDVAQTIKLQLEDKIMKVAVVSMLLMVAVPTS